MLEKYARLYEQQVREVVSRYRSCPPSRHMTAGSRGKTTDWSRGERKPQPPPPPRATAPRAGFEKFTQDQEFSVHPNRTQSSPLDPASKSQVFVIHAAS